MHQLTIIALLAVARIALAWFALAWGVERPRLVWFSKDPRPEQSPGALCLGAYLDTTKTIEVYGDFRLRTVLHEFAHHVQFELGYSFAREACNHVPQRRLKHVAMYSETERFAEYFSMAFEDHPSRLTRALLAKKKAVVLASKLVN